MEHLYEKLSRYAGTDIYPYHMPGHKRQGWGMLPEAWYANDITEIEGFDNLHQPQGILQELQKEAAGLYGAEESYYLVNGSTCGILSAVSSAVPFGGQILMARNCHKSAYHAAYLRHLRVSYLYPSCLEEYGIPEAVSSAQLQRALEVYSGIQAVLLVSPTYEGRIADVSAIAAIVHERGIPLIVDEAHGAHLGLAEGFPANSCQAGADLVIHSVHKTLPSLTQTALLHVNGQLIDRDRLRRFLSVYQTSSPSYPLMAGIDNALQYVRLQGKAAFRQFRERYGKMVERLSGCHVLSVLSGESGKQDVGKLLISVKQSGITGIMLSDILLQEYHLQTEMASKDFVLAMFTINDGEEAYRRMEEALLETDSRLSGQNKGRQIISVDSLREKTGGTRVFGEKGLYVPENIFAEKVQRQIFSWREGGTGEPAERNFSLAEAWDMKSEEIRLEDSAGRYAAEFINLYPPGIPLLVPGEQMTEGIYQEIVENLDAGLNVQGIRIAEGAGPQGKHYFMKVIR